MAGFSAKNGESREMTRNQGHDILKWREDLGRRLRSARGTESQGSLAARSGVSDRTISALEQRRLERIPRPGTIARLAIATAQDPLDWLACVGLAIEPREIDRLRELIGVRASPERLKPYDVIEQEYRAYVEKQLARFKPHKELEEEVIVLLKRYVERELSRFEEPARIRSDTRAYTDAKFQMLEGRVRDIETRLEQLANRQRDLVSGVGLWSGKRSRK